MSSLISTPPKWVTWWFAFSTVIVCWDAGYCFMRPRSMVGGDLAWIWHPYNMVPYGAIDLIYGFSTLEAGDGFTNAQALLNLIEAVLNLEYIYLRHTSPRSSGTVGTAAGKKGVRYHGYAPLVGFAASLMTLSKTSLYFFQAAGREAHGQSTSVVGAWSGITHGLISSDTTSLPTVWVVMPLVVCVVLGRFITRQLLAATASEVAYAEFTHASNEKPITKAVSPKRPTLPVSSTLVNSHIARAPDGSSYKAYPQPQLGAALPLTFTPIDSVVLIVGANKLAATRAFAFLEAGAEVVIVSPKDIATAHEEVRHRVDEGQLRFVQRSVSGREEWKSVLDEHDVSLVCVTDTLIGTTGQRDRSAAEAIFDVCKKSRIPVNVSDHPRLSTYSFPSVHRFAGAEGPSHLQVAVSTNGQGCRLSSRLKREIVTRLPVSVGAAVDNVGRLRLRARSKSIDRTVSEDDPDTPLNNPVAQLDTPSLLSGVNKQLGESSETGDEQLRRMRWVHQMSEYYSFEALARMTEGEMDRALRTWEDNPVSAQKSLPQHDGQVGSVQKQGRIFLIGSGPGHPGLLTLAAHHVLRSATLILSDKLVPAEILALIPSTTELHIAKKFPGNNEGAQNELMIQALEGARRGETVVRLKQGDPFVYGRGGEEVLYFREHGFESTVIPGVTSAIAGPEMVGIPVTQRGVSEGFVLCTGVGRAGKSVNLPGYVKPRTLVVLMGVARIGNIVSTLVDLDSAGRDGTAYPPHLPIAVVERASSPDQRVIVSTLANIEEAVKSVEERPPGMMLIGWAVLALEGKGRVDVLDLGVDGEEGIVSQWMGGDRWRIREGLDSGWGEYLAGLGA